MKIQCESIVARDLKPGDLFSVAGPEYWDYIDLHQSIGEKIFIRTNVPADEAKDADAGVYRITILTD